MARTTLWIALFLVAVGGGYGARYYFAPQPPAPEDLKVLVKPQPQDPAPPEDLSLKLPPADQIPRADMNVLDPSSFLTIKGHYSHLNKSLLEDDPLPKVPHLTPKEESKVNPKEPEPMRLPTEIRDSQPQSKRPTLSQIYDVPPFESPEPPIALVGAKFVIEIPSLELPKMDAAKQLPPLEIPCPPQLKSPPRIAEAKTVFGYLPTRQASFDLDVTQTGTSGIKAAELWTIDSHGEAHLMDRTSEVCKPFRTSLPGEGIHDIALVLVSGSGRRSSLKNDEAVRVVVDMTPPEVKLLGITPDAAKPGNAMIEWFVKDAHLDTESLILEYSTDRKEWHLVTTERIPNTGKYSWDPKNLLSHEVQLRLRATDRAGNEGEAYLPELISVDVVPPKGKIKGVRNVETGARPTRIEILPIPRIASDAPGVH